VVGVVGVVGLVGLGTGCLRLSRHRLGVGSHRGSGWTGWTGGSGWTG
jgi:hypothetical protein